MKTEKFTADSPKGVITLYRITNESGASVVLSSLGAGINAVTVPDKNGALANVCLGYKIPAVYIADVPCMGKTPGRYANRIKEGHFSLDGVQYSLAINNGPNALHGGPEGFMNQIWEDKEVENGVEFTYRAADGEEGYPGALTAVCTYTWSNDNVLTIAYKATCDRKTVVNLTNHSYFNLAGEDNGCCLDHLLQMNCSRWLPTSEFQIPLGEMAPVAGTPMDFTAPKAIGKDINADFEALHIGKGYDHCWMMDNWEKGVLKPIATLCHEGSGRVLEVLTTQPAAQVYTGNWLAGCPESVSGNSYADYAGVAIECQGCPDAPNHDNFPCQVLVPGEEYNQTIKFAFKVK